MIFQSTPKLEPDVNKHDASLVRPFLKWPGGKFRLVNTLQALLPNHTYLVEPFVGAGALFINTAHLQVRVNDINPDLINLYSQLKKKHTQFIKEAKKFFIEKNNTENSYYQFRDRFNATDDSWERAILFLFLNRHGYNGLCRYNAKGVYNVPFGNYVKPYFPQHELECFRLRAPHVSFQCQDFAHFLKPFLKQSRKKLQQTTFYCDPPYSPLSSTANFTNYSGRHFTAENQVMLAKLALALSKKGATVLISNHNTPFTRELYCQANCQLIEVRRTISCKANDRKKVAELIACFSPLTR